MRGRGKTNVAQHSRTQITCTRDGAIAALKGLRERFPLAVQGELVEAALKLSESHLEELGSLLGEMPPSAPRSRNRSGISQHTVDLTEIDLDLILQVGKAVGSIVPTKANIVVEAALRLGLCVMAHKSGLENARKMIAWELQRRGRTPTGKHPREHHRLQRVSVSGTQENHDRKPLIVNLSAKQVENLEDTPQNRLG